MCNFTVVQGIYAADAFEKSEGYCYNDGGGRSKYMLLCEVRILFVFSRQKHVSEYFSQGS